VIALELPYGPGTLRVQVPEANLQGILQPAPGFQAADEATLLRQALAGPIGAPCLRKIARAGQRVVIVTSDLTRPCPSERLLPPLLDELAVAGVRDADVTVVLALGLHRPMSEAEREAAVGAEVYRRVRVVNHDPADTVRLGVTSAGTPVEIYRLVVEADLRVCVGNVELHYFAGYSGGAKAILPGCASKATLNANHAMMVRPEAAAGRLPEQGNPLRADIEEGAALLGVDFILNVVVDGRHRIVGAVAGDVTAAHRLACELVAQRGIVEIASRADLVLASAGGHPKDINFYQAQKALDNAACAVRQGGILVLAAMCPEGLGNRTFEEWMTAATCPDDLLERIRQEFVIGGHKAAAVAAVLKRARIYLVSALPEALVRRCGMVPFGDLDSAVKAALGDLGSHARIVAMPQAGSVLPVLWD
jgi:nickel-dependent lactate racemase